MTQTRSIAFLINDLGGFGGTERVLSRVSNELASRGFEIHLISRHRFGSEFFSFPDNAVRHVLRFGAAKGMRKSLQAVFELSSLLRDVRADALIVVDICHCYLAVPAAILAMCPVVAWEHFNLARNLKGERPSLSYLLAARFAVKYVCPTLAGASEHASYGLVKPDKISLIFNPLSFSYPDANGVSQERLMLFVGRMAPPKNPIDTLRAWWLSGLSEEGWSIVFIGGGPFCSQLESFILEHGVKGVQLVGRASDVASWYRRARVLCGSSLYEGFGLVIIEAEAFGVPAIFYDCPVGPGDLIREGETGYLVRVGDVDGMAAAMRRMAHRTAEEADAMFRACRAAAKTYDAHQVGDEWETLLSNICR